MRGRRTWFRHVPRRERHQRCTDCRIDITPETRHHHPRPGRWQPIPGCWHWYLVRDDVWALAGMEPDGGYLCIPCLERRLGQPLTAADLLPSLINDPTDLDAPPLLRLKKELAFARAWEAAQIEPPES